MQLLLVFVFTVSFTYSSKACSPLAVPPLANQAIVGNNLLLDWQSVNVWICPGYSVQVEITCQGSAFTGNGPFFWSPTLDKTVTTMQAYPQQTVDISTLCPGTVYQFRAREVEQGAFVFSGWTSTFTFTTPGTFVPPTINANASNNIVCPPQTSQLNANIVNSCGGPFTFLWSPAAGLSNPNIANPVANPSVSTTYSVVVSGGPLGCWTATGSVNINTGLNPPGVGTASALPAVLCTGKSATLVLSTFTGNIQWQSAASAAGPWTDIPGALTNSFVTSPLTSNTCFQAVVSSCSGTITSNITCVNINQVPVLAPTVQQISCSIFTASANMGNPGSSGAPNSVTWTPTPLSQLSQSTVATYTTPGTVTVTSSFPDGCVSTATLTINPPPPTLTFAIANGTGSPSITCLYSSINLSVSTTYSYGTLTYYWSSASFTASTATVNIVNPGTYTCIVTDPATNCSASHTIQIFKDIAAPVASVTPINQNITCGPGVVATCTAIAVTPSINVTHCWFSPGVQSPNCSGGPISIYYPIVGTNTYVLTNDLTGCTTTTYVNVVSSGGNYPTINITSPQNFTLGCSTKSVASITMIGQVPGGGAVSYTLLAPSFTGTNYTPGTTNVYSVTTPGTYTVIVKNNANACETRLPLSIIQNINPPDIGYSVATQTLSCDVPSLNIAATSTTSAASFVWAFNSSPGTTPAYTVTVRTNTAGASVPSATVIDTYTLTVTDPNNLCTSRTTVKMYQNTRPPIPIISGAIPLTCLTNSVNLTNSSQSGILAATFFTTQAIAGYSWTGPPPQQPDTATSSYQAFTPGTYTLIAKDLNNGCMSQTTAVVGDNRNYPVIQTATQVALDCGAANGAGVKLPATVLGIPANGVTAQWLMPLPTPSVSGVNSLTLTTDGIGEYELVVTTNSNSCQSVAFVKVVSGQLDADFTPDKTTGFAPLTVNFTNNSASTSTTSGTSSITSVWSFGNGTTKTTTNVATTSAVYNQPGTYTVTMFARKGACLDTVSKVILVDIPSRLEVPNVFTPNGDNSNDIFFLKTANLTDINIVIYDRWGNEVYKLDTDKGNIAWDGKNQAGKEVPDGTYFYVIKATGKDGEAYSNKGNVSLYR